MPKRLAVVVGSQCEKQNHLVALPESVNRWRKIIFDQKLGDWSPAHGEGVFLDTNAQDLYDILESSFRQGSEDEAVLLLVYVGHGVCPYGDFYLLPKDGDSARLGKQAIFLNQTLKELSQAHRRLRGLIVILDTCHSGAAVLGALDRLAEAVGKTPLDYLSSTDTRLAYNCEFSTQITAILERGIDDSPEKLHCAHLREALGRLPEYSQVSFNAALGSNADLFVAHNLARTRFWEKSQYALRIRRLLETFVPTAEISKVCKEVQQSPILALVGPPGTGKSTIIAALTTPRTDTSIPSDFVHAVAFLDESSKDYDLAKEFSDQLKRSLGDSWESARKIERDNREARDQKLGPLIRDIARPLMMLEGTLQVRFALDAVNQCLDPVRHNLFEFLDYCHSNHRLSHVSFVFTSVNEFELPNAAKRLNVREPTGSEIRSFLTHVGINKSRQEAIIEKASGNWLLAKLLADREIDPDGASDWRDIYRSRISLAGEAGKESIISILIHLATPGIGLEVPVEILQKALANGAPQIDLNESGRLLERLGGLLAWSSQRNVQRVGLFHQTLVDFIRSEYVDKKRSIWCTDHFLSALSAIQPGDEPNDLRAYAERIEPSLHWSRFLETMDELEEEQSEKDRSHLLSILDFHARAAFKSLEARDEADLWKDWSERFHIAIELSGVDEQLQQTLCLLWITSRTYLVMETVSDYRELTWLLHAVWSDLERILEDALELQPSEQLEALKDRFASTLFEDQEMRIGDHLKDFIECFFSADAIIRSRFLCWWTRKAAHHLHGYQIVERMIELTEQAVANFGANHLETIRMLNAMRDLSYDVGVSDKQQIYGFLGTLSLPPGSFPEKVRDDITSSLCTLIENQTGLNALY